MVVTVKHKNGIRYGNYQIYDIKGRFPVQAITSTNLNHVQKLKSTSLDFKTTFLEIIEKFPKRIVEDSDYRQDRIKTISKIIQKNPARLSLLALSGVRSSVRMNKKRNLSMIQFQIDCGFKLIKVYFRNPTKAMKILKEYRSLIPKDRSLVVVLDENLENYTFKALYFNALKHRDKIICFVGREPKKNNDDNRLNFQFIARRKKDKMIRLVSLVKKSFDGVVGSLIYHLFGFDVYSFLTRFGNPNIPVTELKALNGFRYESLTSSTNLVCVATGINLYKSSKRFENKKNSSVPLSVHDIVRLNELFEVLQKNYTRKKLVAIVGDRIF